MLTWNKQKKKSQKKKTGTGLITRGEKKQGDYLFIKFHIYPAAAGSDPEQANVGQTPS